MSNKIQPKTLTLSREDIDALCHILSDWEGAVEDVDSDTMLEDEYQDHIKLIQTAQRIREELKK